nr:MAG TPA: hypothetical protein [Caudoviricetes sp.]
MDYEKAAEICAACISDLNSISVRGYGDCLRMHGIIDALYTLKNELVKEAKIERERKEADDDTNADAEG